jgi:hypothetical protein
MEFDAALVDAYFRWALLVKDGHEFYANIDQKWFYDVRIWVDIYDMRGVNGKVLGIIDRLASAAYRHVSERMGRI